LREHFTPVDHIAYSYLVYDVPKDMLPQGGGDSKSPKELPPGHFLLMTHLDRFPLTHAQIRAASHFPGDCWLAVTLDEH
jgi:hypothetical protein